MLFTVRRHWNLLLFTKSWHALLNDNTTANLQMKYIWQVVHKSNMSFHNWNFQKFGLLYDFFTFHQSVNQSVNKVEECKNKAAQNCSKHLKLNNDRNMFRKFESLMVCSPKKLARGWISVTKIVKPWIKKLLSRCLWTLG